MAHTASGALHFGVAEKKVAAIVNYKTSPLFSHAERSALDLAVAASSIPNAVTDEMFAELRRHWSEEQIIEIVATVAALGFLNRWNTTMATPIEPEPLAVGRKHLAPHGWSAGIHER
jgi:alkylhydroperoxidase family enzyme